MKSTGKLARTALALLAGTAIAASASSAWAQDNRIELQWWHAMGGALGERVNEIAAGFNKGQDKYKIVAVNKGSYPETLTAAMAAFRAGKGPHIVQVFEVGTGTIQVNGGGAHHVKKGDLVIIATFTTMPTKRAKKYRPKVVFVDSSNAIRRGEVIPVATTPAPAAESAAPAPETPKRTRRKK